MRHRFFSAARASGTFVDPEQEQQLEAFWQFGPTDEPADTSRLSRSLGGVSREETDDSLFVVENEPAQQLDSDSTSSGV